MDARRSIEAVWRIECPRLVASLTRLLRDVGLAEEVAQDAFVAALEQWPRDGVPDRPGAWLMAAARNRAIDRIRRERGRDERYALLAEPAGRGRPTRPRRSATTCSRSSSSHAIRCSRASRAWR